MFLQKTIRRSVVVKGVGLHSGEPSAVRFRPALENTGIHFVRKDMAHSQAVRVEPRQVSATQLATTLSNRDFSVSTVEHCLSALAAFRIDNVIIELTGPEIPICDGSAKSFAEAIRRVGFVEQEAPRKYLYVTRPVYFGTDENSSL